jgi:hypothetical protein
MHFTSRANKSTAAPRIGWGIGGAAGVAERVQASQWGATGDCGGGESRALYLGFWVGFDLGEPNPTQP